MADNPHNGHRKRLKKELLEQDFPESTPPHKILEALLFYGIPRKDTNLIAHDLLKTFGSLSAVFQANPHDLLQIKGMTENSVTLIKMIMPIARKVYIDEFKGNFRFNNIDDYGEYIVKRFFGYNKEVFIISSLDSCGKLLGDDIIAIGDVDNVTLSVKSIVRAVLQRNPTAVIISHNHVDSPAVPSLADINMTQSLKFTLEQINVKLLDHIIVSGNDYVSIKQSANYNSVL